MKETAHGDSLANTEGNYQRTRMIDERLEHILATGMINAFLEMRRCFCSS